MTRAKWFRPAVAAVVVIAVAAVLGFVFLGGDDSTAESAATTTSAASATTTTELDPAVVDLQQTMTRLGYYSGPIDGVYGSATTAAVVEMQKALGVPADGVYGPATDAALKGKAKDVVVRIQTALADYGYYTGPIDGHYGEGTKDAVKQLQTDLGITADGLVGAETLKAFDKAVADGMLTKPATTTSTATTTG